VGKFVKTNPIRVAIADDHEAIRTGLAAAIGHCSDMEVVGTYCNGNEAIQKVGSDKPDVLIMDINMPGINGVDAIPHVLKEHKHNKVILFTLHRPEMYAAQAFESGAYAFIGKDESLTSLLDAIRVVSKNRKVISNEISEILVNRMQKGSLDLTPREMEVLRAFLEGRSNKEIAKTLNISEKTVSTHKIAIMEKFGVKTDVELTMYSIKNGFTQI
jgi:DNA-binding NarL/FixJ family response regulator